MKRIELEPVVRAASFDAETVNKEERTIDLVWSTGATVLRSSPRGAYHEELSMDPEHVRLDWLNSGNAPLIDTHNATTVRAVLGVVKRAWIDSGGIGRATVRFSSRPDVDGIWQDIQDGVIKNASVGTQPIKAIDASRAGDAIPTFRILVHEPQEISVCPRGLDHGAGFRSGSSEPISCELEDSQEAQQEAQPASRPGPGVSMLRLALELEMEESL